MNQSPLRKEQHTTWLPKVGLIHGIFCCFPFCSLSDIVKEALCFIRWRKQKPSPSSWSHRQHTPCRHAALRYRGWWLFGCEADADRGIPLRFSYGEGVGNLVWMVLSSSFSFSLSLGLARARLSLSLSPCGFGSRPNRPLRYGGGPPLPRKCIRSSWHRSQLSIELRPFSLKVFFSFTFLWSRSFPSSHLKPLPSPPSHLSLRLFAPIELSLLRWCGSVVPPRLAAFWRPCKACGKILISTTFAFMIFRVVRSWNFWMIWSRHPSLPLSSSSSSSFSSFPFLFVFSLVFRDPSH